MNSCRKIVLVLLVGCCPCLPAQSPVGDLSAADASVKGAVVMSSGSTHILSGSTIAAGQNAASLRLARGGEVRVCPGSSLSVSASQSGHELLFAVGTGAIEIHYRLESSADSVLTPDFRILLAGPGVFHFAFASDANGNTCVRSLPFDSASVIVNELMGEGIYQVRAGEQVLFHGGMVKDASNAIPPDCGCPAPAPLQRAEGSAAPEPTPQAQNRPADSRTAAPPPIAPGETQVTVDAPFVFRGDAPLIPPAPAIAHLRLEHVVAPVFPSPLAPASSPSTSAAAASEPAGKPAAKAGVFHRLRSFFASVFH
jgi:hypothetical protein